MNIAHEDLGYSKTKVANKINWYHICSRYFEKSDHVLDHACGLVMDFAKGFRGKVEKMFLVEVLYA